jgi:hypothetical protein
LNNCSYQLLPSCLDALEHALLHRHDDFPPRGKDGMDRLSLLAELRLYQIAHSTCGNITHLYPLTS